MSMRKAIIAAAMTLAVLGAAQAQAPAPVTTQPVDLIAVRQAIMGGNYGSWRALTAAVAAKAEPKNFILSAKGLLATGRLIPVLFPANAGIGRLGLPAMIEDRAGFERATAAFVSAAEALLKVTQANDAEAFPDAVKAITASCGGCHPRPFARNWNE